MKRNMEEYVAHLIESTADMLFTGFQNAKLDPRKNANWDIIWIYPVAQKPGDRPCEIVIGDRHTRFEPYVAWHCFDKKDYSWGCYCQTFGQAFMCADEKIRKEGSAENE